METVTTNLKTKAKINRTATVPQKDVDFGKVITSVSTKWSANPWLVLLWTNATDFSTKAINYQNTLDARKQTGSGRPQITQALKTLDKDINDKIAYVKGYIIDKYKKEAAKSYYASFGFQQIGKAYKLPTDQNGRSAALLLMISAIDSNGFGTKEFGTTYWTTAKTQYDDLLVQASTKDSQVSIKVGDKNILKADLKKVLNSIILTIKANYPDTYKSELRSWGMHKEKY